VLETDACERWLDREDWSVRSELDTARLDWIADDGRTAIAYRTLAGAKRIPCATQSSAGGAVYSLSEVHCT